MTQRRVLLLVRGVSPHPKAELSRARPVEEKTPFARPGQSPPRARIGAAPCLPVLCLLSGHTQVSDLSLQQKKWQTQPHLQHQEKRGKETGKETVCPDMKSRMVLSF